MAHARWWDAVAARLAPQLHLFAVDLPGHGESPWLEPRRYAYVELPVIRALLAMLAPGPWIVAGHSNGGLQAVVLATEDDGLLRGLIVVDIPLDPMAPRLVQSGKGIRRLPQPRWPTRDAAVAAFRLFPKTGDASPETLADLGAHSVRETGDGSWTTKFDWRYFRGRDPEAPNPYVGFDARLARIRCPTLVIRGSQSSIQRAEDHETLLARLPDARGVTIAGAGHNPHVERPEATASAIRDFALRARVV
jgi:pimeloyl-ACP methyl ester carboxylesterase